MINMRFSVAASLVTMLHTSLFESVELGDWRLSRLNSMLHGNSTNGTRGKIRQISSTFSSSSSTRDLEEVEESSTLLVKIQKQQLNSSISRRDGRSKETHCIWMNLNFRTQVGKLADFLKTSHITKLSFMHGYPVIDGTLSPGLLKRAISMESAGSSLSLEHEAFAIPPSPRLGRRGPSPEKGPQDVDLVCLCLQRCWFDDEQQRLSCPIPQDTLVTGMVQLPHPTAVHVSPTQHVNKISVACKAGETCWKHRWQTDRKLTCKQADRQALYQATQHVVENESSTCNCIPILSDLSVAAVGWSLLFNIYRMMLTRSFLWHRDCWTVENIIYFSILVSQLPKILFSLNVPRCSRLGWLPFSLLWCIFLVLRLSPSLLPLRSLRWAAAVN